MFSYNLAIRESTEFTPHELIVGRKARIPSEFADQAIPITFIQLFNTTTTTQASAVKNLERAKEKCKRYYDRNINPRVFNADDYVYLRREPRLSKFVYHWDGPYKIRQVFNNRNVEISINQKRTKVVHTNKLKPAHTRLEPPAGA